MRKMALGAAVAAFAGLLSAPALADPCEGQVVDVRPIHHYDHARGEGFLAVRVGPGAVYAQAGELYRGDRVAVLDRDGNWFAVQCVAGECLEPIWGDPAPQGWAYGRYLRLAGECP